MTLLVVGLVAVIVVILIAVFLSTRTGRGDDHDDARARPGNRDRRRSEEERWPERPRDVREGDRGPSGGRHPGRRVPDHHSGARELAPAYSEQPRRRRELPAPRSHDYDEPQRRTRRPDTDGRPVYDTDGRPVYDTDGRPVYDSSGYSSSPARRALPARASSEGRGRYDSQPLPRVAVDDFPVDDFPRADYPSPDFPPAEFAAAEPRAVAPATALPAPPSGRDSNQDSRRKPARAAHGDGGAKGRSRPHRGRHDDDDDWPSTEWDQLSDEQYWKELSADKPVSSMNPPAPGKSSNTPAASPPKSLSARAARPEPVPSKPVLAEPAGAPPGGEQGRELPSRKQRTAPREAVTERLPVRPRPQRAPVRAIESSRTPRQAPLTPAQLKPAPVNPAALNPAAVSPAPVPQPLAAPPESPPNGDQGLAVLADLGKTISATPPNARDDDPLTSPSFSRKAVSAHDSRSYGNGRKNGSADPSLTGLERERKNGSGGGKHRAAQPPDDQLGVMPLAAPLGQHPSGPYPVVPVAASNGAHTAGQHQSGPYPVAAAQQPSTPYPAGAAHGRNGFAAGQHPSGPYPVGGYPSGDYTQDAASPGSWYNMPAEAASLPGADVSYAAAGAPRANGGGFADGHAATGYPGRDYLASSYQGQGYTAPGSPQGLPGRRDSGEPAEAVTHPSFPGGQPGPAPYWDGQPGQAPHPNAYAKGEYTHGYGNDHGEPYQAGGYGG